MSKSKKNVPKPKGRGRPPHVPTQLSRQRVERYSMGRMTYRQIADCLGIDVNTLQKHYPDEIRFGAVKKRGEVYDMLFDAAEQGNVSAQRKLLQVAEGIERELTVKEIDKLKRDHLKEEENKKLGKKEMAQEEADNIKGKYEPPSAPRLVVDNK